MIQTEYLQNGSLIRHYSDSGKMLQQNETGLILSDPIDAVPCIYTYTEVDQLINEEDTTAAEIANLWEKIDNMNIKKSYPSLIASGSLPIVDTMLRCSGNKEEPYSYFIVYIYIPADGNERSLECKVNNKSIGKVVDINCDYNQIIAFKGELKGYWTLEYDQYISSSYTSLAAFRNTAIPSTATQKHLSFFGKGGLMEKGTNNIVCMANIPLPVGTEYEIWAC